MFITSKNKYLSNDMKIFGTWSIPLSCNSVSIPLVCIVRLSIWGYFGTSIDRVSISLFNVKTDLNWSLNLSALSLLSTIFTWHWKLKALTHIWCTYPGSVMKTNEMIYIWHQLTIYKWNNSTVKFVAMSDQQSFWSCRLMRII